MFPRPTAKPMDARMNSDLCPQLSRVDFTTAPSSAFSITAETDVGENSHHRDGTSITKMIVNTSYFNKEGRKKIEKLTEFRNTQKENYRNLKHSQVKTYS